MITLNYKNWNIENLTGYKPLTTFYMDFSLAEPFGESAIKDTLKKTIKVSKTNYKFLTELVMVLNWKINEHYQQNRKLATLYNQLWEEMDNYACENLKDEELSYFFETTD